MCIAFKNPFGVDQGIRDDLNNTEILRKQNKAKVIGYGCLS